jgi:5'-3' exonuclease
MIATMMAQLGNHTNVPIDEDMFRHMVLNVIRSYRVKFKEYGEIVIACDDKKSWRKEYFPLYKANRKKSREQSELDWNAIFYCLNTVRDELKTYFPYRVIHVDGAEADDIIATLCMTFGSLLATKEKILILSGDKDFVQLHVYSNVEQFDPVNKRFVKNNDPHQYLREHILKGDRGDGIPNVLSPDNCIVEGVRQKALREDKLKMWTSTPDLQKILTPEQYAHFKRNEMLIDLHNIPQHIQDDVLSQYHAEAGKKRDRLFSYFIEHKLKHLMEHISEF